MKKRILLFVGLLVFIIGIAACGNGNGGTTIVADTEGGHDFREPLCPIEDRYVESYLFFWIFDETLGQPLADGFNEVFPNIQVDWEHVGMTDMRGLMEQDGPADIGPDVFVQPHDGVAIAINDGMVEPFPQSLQERLAPQLLTSAVETTMRDGRMYGAPFQTENIALFYNRAYVDSPPATFEEIREFAREWNNPAENRFAMRWQVADAYHNYPFLQAFGFSVFGPNMDDWRDMPFESEAVRRGIEFHNSFRPYFDFATDDVDWENSVAAFQRGEVPFTISGPWAIADAQRNGVDFGITRLPTINGVQPRVFSGATIAHVSSFSRYQDIGFTFVEWLATAGGATVLFDTIGTLTAMYDISAVPGLADDPHLMGIQEQAPYSDPMPVIPEVNFMWGPLATVFTHSWNGTLSIEETQAQAMQEYRDLLAVAGLSLDDE